MYIRYIYLAYVQSDTSMEIYVYFMTMKEMEFKSKLLLKPIKPLYGIQEVGLQLYLKPLEPSICSWNEIYEGRTLYFL